MTQQNDEIMSAINKHIEQLKNDEFNVIMDYINYYKLDYEKKLQDKQKDTVLEIPNDKVVLSASVFSKLVNFVAIKENEDEVYKGFLNEMLEDVKQNRSAIKTSNHVCHCKQKVTPKADNFVTRDVPKHNHQQFKNLFNEAFEMGDMYKTNQSLRDLFKLLGVDNA